MGGGISVFFQLHLRENRIEGDLQKRSQEAEWSGGRGEWLLSARKAIGDRKRDWLTR